MDKMDMSKVLNESAARGNLDFLTITWDELGGDIREKAEPVDLPSMWTTYGASVKSEPKEIFKRVLLQGKRCSDGLKRRAAMKGDHKAKIGNYMLDFSDKITEKELNFQRLSALFAMANAGKKDPKEAIDTAMGSVIPPYTQDARSANVFHKMLAPGYGFIYKVFWTDGDHAMPFSIESGDRGRYFAGAVMLDWLQAYQTGTPLSLAEFAAGKMYGRMKGTVRQIVTNTGQDQPDLEMTSKELKIFQKILNRKVFPTAGMGAEKRTVDVVSKWESVPI